jgi:GT2 family glycosyltransferase
VLLLRAEALAQVGGLDERFFLYAEETDWAYRAARLGWRHAVVDSAQAVHTGAGTSSDVRRRQAHFHGSQERYARKHFGALGWQVLRAAQIVGSAGRALALRGERRAGARLRLQTYLAGPIRVESAYREHHAESTGPVTSKGRR